MKKLLKTLFLIIGGTINGVFTVHVLRFEPPHWQYWIAITWLAVVTIIIKWQLFDSQKDEK